MTARTRAVWGSVPFGRYAWTGEPGFQPVTTPSSVLLFGEARDRSLAPCGRDLVLSGSIRDRSLTGDPRERSLDGVPRQRTLTGGVS